MVTNRFNDIVDTYYTQGEHVTKRSLERMSDDVLEEFARLTSDLAKLAVDVQVERLDRELNTAAQVEALRRFRERIGR